MEEEQPKNIDQKESLLQTRIGLLKGITPKRAEHLISELGTFVVRDLLYTFPFRYEDRTQFFPIGQITEENDSVQLLGQIRQVGLRGEGRKMRLEATLEDGSGEIKLVWFRSVQFMQKKVQRGKRYIVYGKPNMYGRYFSIPHPEMEEFSAEKVKQVGLVPVYPSTERLKRAYLDGRNFREVIKNAFRHCWGHIEDFLPEKIREAEGLIDRAEALKDIHFPRNEEKLDRATRRLKFEELFLAQLRILQNQKLRQEKNRGLIFSKAPTLSEFYEKHLPFELTNAQKRVIKEVYADLHSGQQMNRLLQGDVGSGKTIVAFLVMLIAHDGGAQSCLMAPTEILAEQHYRGLSEQAEKIGLKIALLTGSTKKAARKKLFEKLEAGEIHILVGTHALLEDPVQFKNLGFCVIDEQHRFGVAQRARLWKKNPNAYPHMLVMTATPIPRTLAMTLYGDLDVSVIDELPAGRLPIKTLHRREAHRLRIIGQVKEEIAKGRQVYWVYPLIEESEKLDYQNLMEGYEAITRAFPDQHVSVVHGRMKAQDKDLEMQRFLKKETQIMVATTVIEVGVNVPNASVMVIENAERFGLAQLHQLRGRVGRGEYQSWCILMSGKKLSKESRFRLETMVRTTDGFEIAEADLRLRGPGDITGTQQSGILDFKLANLAKDGKILRDARRCATALLEEDPKLQAPEHASLRRELQRLKSGQPVDWGEIS